MTQENDFKSLFAKEPDKHPDKQDQPAWNILLVDDEPDIHAALRISLQDIVIKDRPLNILEAGSSSHAKQILQSNHDIALILLDVVMETNQAGLELVKYIRNELDNRITQIILVTGQPGYAPQQQVISEYEINGYILKSELTSERIFSAVYTSLRTYQMTRTLEDSQDHLEQLVEERTSKLKKAKQNAEKANQAKSMFLANISHELRTPMHAILSFSSIGTNHTDDEKTRHYFDNIHTSGERLTKLLDDLLDLSKLESKKLVPEFSEHNLTVLVYSVIDELASLIGEKKIRVDCDCKHPVMAHFDKNLVTQVVVNLLSNAIKYSPENSHIVISLTGSDSETLVFSITDEGIGIPENELEDIFDSFVQSSKTRSKSGGTGLGLPISKEIISLHKGKIWAESPPVGKEKGSQFKFEIPVLQKNIS